MLIEIWPIDRPKPYPQNARKWTAAAVDKVASSIGAYGFRQPIVVDREDVIIIGHLRLVAAKKLRLKEVPVHVARDLTPEQVRGLRLMDNRSHEEADWDLSFLVPELAELGALAFDLNLTGFEVHELDSLLRLPIDETRAEAVPPLPEVAVTRSGDLWICGKHYMAIETLDLDLAIPPGSNDLRQTGRVIFIGLVDLHVQRRFRMTSIETDHGQAELL